MRTALLFILVYPSAAAALLLLPLFIVGWHRARSAHERERWEWMIVLIALADPAGAIAKQCAYALGGLLPMRYDLYVFEIDRLLGEPSFRLGQFIAVHAWAFILANLAYGLLPLAGVGAIAAILWRESREATVRALRAFAVNLFLAVPIYLLIPVSGPAYAFPGFPALPASALPHSIALRAAPNGIPSVHASTALLILWFLRRWRWGRAAALLFLVLTVFATLASGEHYAFDLFCAVPYAALVLALTASRQPVAVLAAQTQQTEQRSSPA